MKKIKVYVEIEKNGQLPHSGSIGAAGLDIYAAEDTVILPGETRLVATKLKIAIPEGYEIQIRPRSGLSLKTAIRIANSPGTIDSDYRDEIKIICENKNNFDSWKDDLLRQPELLSDLKAMQRICLLDYLSAKGEILLDQEQGSIEQELAKSYLYLREDGYPYGTIVIKKGERFAQMVFAAYQAVEFVISDNVQMIGENREGGFGSTGK